MRKTLILAILAAAVARVSGAATRGSCESAAADVSFAASGTLRTVTLTAEYDEDDKSYDTSRTDGVYYFKTTLKRGLAYTVWTSGVTTNAVSVTAYPKDASSDDEDEPSADFEDVEEPGDDTRMILSADDWYVDEDGEDSDPKSWTYYVVITGPWQSNVTIHFAQGVVYPVGREENPRSIAPGTSDASVSAALGLGNEYHFRARLLAGRLYSFATTGGDAENALSISVAGETVTSGDDEEVEYGFESYENPAYADDECNDGVFVIPDETGYFIITVAGDVLSDDENLAAGDPSDDGNVDLTGAPFKLVHSVYAAQPAASHVATALTEENGWTAAAEPGRIISEEKFSARIFDAVIDESLFSFTAKKGARYVAKTEGAATNLMMRVYDSAGNVTAENLTDGASLNVRCGWTAASAGTYYVGVCQNLLNPFVDTPAYLPVTVGVAEVVPAEGSPDEWDSSDDTYSGAATLSPAPVKDGAAPAVADAAGHGFHRLGATDWADVFAVAARKGVTYSFAVTLKDSGAAFNTLTGEVFTVSGTTERKVATDGDVAYGYPAPLSFTATANGMHYLRLSVAEGKGLDYPEYKLHSTARMADGSPLGNLKVVTLGTDSGTWSVGSETVAYSGGSAIALAPGSYTVKFGRVTGFSQPASVTVEVVAGETREVTVYYSDTFDPKDDRDGAATTWTLKNVETALPRTLWPGDIDHFAITGKDGQFYSVRFTGNGAGAVFSITNALSGTVCENVTRIDKVELPTSRAKYILAVKPGDGYSEGGAYTLAGYFANVGAVKFARTAVTTREDANSVALTVNRTAKDGRVRVRYGTVAGTAKPGVDYVPQSGVLEWAANDNKAKTITVKLIPDLVAEYEGANKTFAVRIEPVDDAEIADDEYKAAISGGDTATVTLTETSRPGVTAETTYAATYVKAATVNTETVPLHTGTFNGLLRETSGTLTNSFPAMASIVFTASTADAISAKVTLAGKTYSFSAKGWNEKEVDGRCAVTMSLPQTVNRVVYTNVLTVSVASGATANPGDWARAGGKATLVMNVPDTDNKGVQAGVEYEADLRRDNSKIQDYLTAVANFGGYYTVALVPEGVTSEDGVPYGNGFLTVTVDNKGKAKVAGQLPDGTTKPSLSVQTAIVQGGDGGCEMVLPVYFAKKPACFGGIMRLALKDASSGVRTAFVSSSGSGFVWCNDNADLRYDGTDGWMIPMTPVGGWYDKVANLQTYYLNAALKVGTAQLSEFPSEALTAGFTWTTDAAAEADGRPVAVAGNAFQTDAVKLLKSASVPALYDFSVSTNPANVQVKLARATGLVTGSFDAWTENGARQVKKTLKHNGVLLFNRDPSEAVVTDVDVFGYFTITGLKLPKLTGIGTRSWTFSAPFNLSVLEEEEPDWWDIDWGADDQD